MNPVASHTPSSRPPQLVRYQERSLLALLACICVAGPLVTLAVYFRDGWTPLAWAGATLTASVYGLLLVYIRGKKVLAATLLVYLLVVMSGVAIAAQGTLRSMASLVLLAAVVGAGVFLPRRHMLACAALGIGLLGVLNIAENQGWLPTPQLKTGWAVWATQTLVVISLVVTVNFGRQRLIDAFRQQHAALERATRVEELLRVSQERFQALFRNTPAACLVQSLDTLGVIDINEAFVHLFGYPRDELLGQPPPKLWADPQAHQAFREAIDRQGRVAALRSRALRRNGELFDAMLYAEVVSSGSDRLLLAVVIDISAEVASRHELEKSRERFSKTFHFSPLGMTITRLSDGMFMEVNPANERVLGWSAHDFSGKTSMEVGVWVNDDDRQRYVDTLRKDGRLQAHETRMRTKAGHVVDVRVWAEIIDIDGEPCALSFTMNVAEEKRREAMLLNIAEGVSGDTGEAFFRSMADHLAQAVGADGVMVGEIDHANSLHTLALVWDGVLHPNSRHDLTFTLCAQTLRQQTLLRLESPTASRLAVIAPFADHDLQGFVGLPLRDADGSAMGLLTVVWKRRPPVDPHLDALLTIFASRCGAELTRLKRDREIRKLQDTLEQRVASRTAQLRYLNTELDTFAYTVSHDLKAPLRSMDGFNHLLREQLAGRLNPDDELLFDRVDASVQRMNRLITDLLALARVSQGTLQRMNTNLSELAQDVIRQERHRDPTRQVSVEIEPDLLADCDPRMAQIVLENLLGNAWKYTRQCGDARIALGRCATSAGDPPAFYVEDNGAGFDMVRADRLFKPFNRLHASNEFEGTGIGLATVRRILERHGGHIQGEGAVGKGARFEFSFSRESANA